MIVLDSKFSRRTFLKGSAAATMMTAIGLGGNGFALAEETAASGAPAQSWTCYNSCPRNCYDTCSMITTVKDGVISSVTGNPNNTYTNGTLCVKGYTYPRRVYSPDRIKYPMKQIGKGSGNWERITWDEAFQLIAEKILDIKDRHGNTLPVCLNKYSGNFNVLSYGVEGMMDSIGHTTTAQGTPCWPAGIDAQTFDTGTLLSSDPEMMKHSKMIIVWGANPAWCAVHSMNIIQKARENGCKIIVIDPILTDTAAKADQYIEIKASTDGALALGMAKYILDHKLQDDGWMDKNSIGSREFIDYVNNSVTIEWASEKTGIPVNIIETLAQEYATTDPACIWIGYGMQRHTNGGAAVRAIDALVALTGNFGKLGAGGNYGQLDSWGFNYHAMVHAGVNADNAESNRFVNINDFGADVLKADPAIELLWVACRNPISQDADTALMKKAFESIDLVVTADQFMNPTVELSDIVLPVTTIFETWGLHASYWHYWMNVNEPAIEPMYEAKCDIEIAMGLAKKLNELRPGSSTFNTSLTMKEWVAAEMSDSFIQNFGFESWEGILEKGTAKVSGYDASWADGNFRTPSKKYEFYSEQAASFGHNPLPVYLEELSPSSDYPIRCMNPHWKYSLHSQFQNLDWVQNIHNEPFAEIHPGLAGEKGIAEGDLIRVYNEIGSVQVTARITRTVPLNTIAIYETWYKDQPFNVNSLVSSIPADMGSFATGQPGIAFHDCFVNIEKA